MKPLVKKEAILIISATKRLWMLGIRKPGMYTEGHPTLTHGRALHYDTSGRTSWASEDRDLTGRPFPGNGWHPQSTFSV